MLSKEIKSTELTPVTGEGFKEASVGKLISEGDCKEFTSRLFRLAPGGHTELHSHEHEQFHVVISGSAKFFDGTSKREVEQGQVVLAESNEPHQFINDGENDFVFVVVFGEKGSPRV